MSSHQCHEKPLLIKQWGPARTALPRASCLIGQGVIIASSVIKDSTSKQNKTKNIIPEPRLGCQLVDMQPTVGLFIQQHK